MNDDSLGTLITFNPCAVRADESVEDLAVRMEQSGYHHWPVVDDERRLVGVVSDGDITRDMAAQRAAEDAQQAGRLPARSTAADIMSPRVVAVDIVSSREHTLERLLEHEIHSLPVLDGEELVGIVTSTDFLRELSQGELPGHRDPVSRHMTKTSESVEADADFDAAKMEIVATGLRYLPVMKGDCPLGVISNRMLRKAKCRQLLADVLHGKGKADVSPRVVDLVKTAPTVKPGDRLATAAGLMVDYSVQAVAVVNQGHKLLGVISEDDILRAALVQSHVVV